MKKIILFLLLVNFFQVGQSQIVKGTLLDKSDNQIISFAPIYINGTSAGTHSDQNGYFELDISKYSSLSLTLQNLPYCKPHPANNTNESNNKSKVCGKRFTAPNMQV